MEFAKISPVRLSIAKHCKKSSCIMLSSLTYLTQIESCSFVAISVVSSASTEKHLDSLIFCAIFLNNIVLHDSIISFWIVGLVYVFLFPGPSRILRKKSSPFALYLSMARKFPCLRASSNNHKN